MPVKKAPVKTGVAKKPAVSSAAAKKSPAAKQGVAKKSAAVKSATKPATKTGVKKAVAKKSDAKENTQAATKELERLKLEEEDTRRRDEHTKQVNERLKREKEEKDKIASEKKQEMLPDAKGVRRIRLERLLEAVQAVMDEGKTPLICDRGAEGEGRSATDAFFSYQSATTIVTKSVFLKVGVHKTVSKEDMTEELRRSLVSAIKNGHVLHLQMNNGATDLNVYDTPDSFPLKKIFTPKALLEEAAIAPIIRDKDKDRNGFFLPKKEFYVVATTEFEEEDVEDFLKESIPLDMCSLIVIKR